MKHIATATNFVGLGVEVCDMITLAMGLHSELSGLKVSHRLPSMSTVARQVYGFEIPRSKRGKQQGMQILSGLAEKLEKIINNNEVDRLEILEKAMAESKHKFFTTLQWV